MKTLQEIRLNDSFSAYLGLDDSSIEVVVEELIDLDAVDNTSDDYIDDISIVKSVLEQHNLLHSDSASNEDDFGEILPLVTVEQANQAITDLINFFSIESFYLQNYRVRCFPISKELVVL